MFLCEQETWFAYWSTAVQMCDSLLLSLALSGGVGWWWGVDCVSVLCGCCVFWAQAVVKLHNAPWPTAARNILDSLCLIAVHFINLTLLWRFSRHPVFSYATSRRECDPWFKKLSSTWKREGWRARTALAEDPGVAPSIHFGWFTQPVTPALGVKWLWPP